MTNCPHIPSNLVTEPNLPSPGLILGRYQVASKLGQGSQGSVWRATDTTSDNSEVAVKIINSATTPGGSAVDLSFSLAEARILAELPAHANVIPLHAAAHTPEGLVMVLGLAETDVFTVMGTSEGGHLDLVAAKNIMSGVLQGLKHCHENGVAHRDIKPENILLCGSTDPAVAAPQLCDFGLAVEIEQKGKAPSMVTGMVGSRAYVAPEVMRGLPYAGAAVDIFCAGVVLYNVMTSFAPWGTSSEEDQLFKCFFDDQATYWAWSRHHSPQELSAEFEDLFCRMCHPDPRERPSASEVLSHPFFSTVNGP